MTCAMAFTLETLVDYYDGELPAQESGALEEHFFACDECTRKLQAIARLESGVRRLVREGRVTFVMTTAARARLEADGVRLREYRLEPGGSVPCSVAPEDELVVLHLVADLDGVARARLTLADDAGILAVEHDDIPVDAARGEVSVAYAGRLIRALPDLVVDVRLHTESPGGPPQLSRYTLLHSHIDPASS